MTTVVKVSLVKMDAVYLFLCQETQQPNVKTPKIDEMLERFRARGFDTLQLSSTTPSATDADSNSGSRAATPGKSRKTATGGAKSKASRFM